jgi:hypothetical protein
MNIDYTLFKNVTRADDERSAQLVAGFDGARAKVRQFAEPFHAGREGRAAALADGGTVVYEDREAALNNARDEVADYAAAIELHQKAAAKRKRDAETEVLKSAQPEFKKLGRRFGDAALALFAVHSEIEELKRQLRVNGVEWRSPYVCDFNTEAEDVLGGVTDKSSNFAFLLRELLKHGHISQLPKGIR